MWGRFSVALLAACVVAAAFAGGSSATLPWIFVKVTPDGPVPKIVHAVAGVTPVAWYGSGVAGRRVVVVRAARPGERRSPPGASK
jgi:hypothetical protein